MCMCAKLYKCHNKSMILPRLLPSRGSGAWVQVSGAGVDVVRSVLLFCVIGVKWG